MNRFAAEKNAPAAENTFRSRVIPMRCLRSNGAADLETQPVELVST